MTDDRFATLLDGAVASFDDEASDWPDVLARVRRRRLRQTVISAALIAGIVLLLSPATGLGQRLLDVFRGLPATPAVKRALGANDRLPPPVLELLRSDPAVDASKARGVPLKCSSGTAASVTASVAIHSRPRCRARCPALSKPSIASNDATNTRLGRSDLSRR